MHDPYSLLTRCALIVLGLCALVCLYRAFRGPKIADRVVAVNMAGTATVMIILLLTLVLKEDYLLDVGLIYAALSFLAVMLLCRILIGNYREKREEGRREGAERDA